MRDSESEINSKQAFFSGHLSSNVRVTSPGTSAHSWCAKRRTSRPYGVVGKTRGSRLMSRTELIGVPS